MSQNIQLTKISHWPSILVVQDLLCKHNHKCYIWVGLGLFSLGSTAQRGRGQDQAQCCLLLASEAQRPGHGC